MHNIKTLKISQTYDYLKLQNRKNLFDEKCNLLLQLIFLLEGNNKNNQYHNNTTPTTNLNIPSMEV